jgi:hypothetical protein
MFLLQYGSKKCEEKSLKLAAILHQGNKRVEYTQLADPSSTTCGPQLRNTALGHSPLFTSLDKHLTLVVKYENNL